MNQVLDNTLSLSEDGMLLLAAQREGEDLVSLGDLSDGAEFRVVDTVSDGRGAYRRAVLSAVFSSSDRSGPEDDLFVKFTDRNSAALGVAGVVSNNFDGTSPCLAVSSMRTPVDSDQDHR